MEYGQTLPPSPARIQQISEEQCGSFAVRRYLGTKFDPNSKFTISMLWPGDRGGRPVSACLCGLQSPGPEQPAAVFKGGGRRHDQSKVWPGCSPGHLMPPPTSRSTPVDCAALHAMEWHPRHRSTWPRGFDAAERTWSRTGSSAMRVHPMTDAYLALLAAYHHPTLIYLTLTLPAGRRQPCGRMQSARPWATGVGNPGNWKWRTKN